VVLIQACLVSCVQDKPVYNSFNGFVQGTTYSIIFQNNQKLDPFVLREEVEALLHNFDMSLSLYQDSSILSRINRNEKVVADAFFTEAFERSKELYELTGGAFDITVGPLVKAWGFGPDAVKRFSESMHDSLMHLVGMDKVELKNGIISKKDPGITLDFNAVAQGFSVDIVCRHLDKLNIDSYLVEIGGEVRVKGERGSSRWRIGIDRPVDYNVVPGTNLQAIISLKDRSLATSGNYRKFFVEDNIKYSHTIDPSTGYPVRHRLLSATIITDDCTAADAVATACMVMGLEKTLDFIKKHSEFEAYLIYSDDNGDFITWISEGLKKSISESD